MRVRRYFDDTSPIERVGLRIDDLPARPSFNRAVVERHDKTPRRRNSFAPSGLFDRSTLSFLTPLRGWRGTPPINTTAMAQQACRQKWLSTPAFSREAAKDNSPGRKPWVGIDKRKALKGRKKFDATFR